MARVLYVSYDGLMEPLGRSQVLQYVRGLSAAHAVFLVTYEKPQDLRDHEGLGALQDGLRSLGIAWTPLPYHKWPTLLATAFDVAAGMLVCASICVRESVEIVHARSYVPGLIGLALKRSLGLRFVFDMRGFWPDQRVDDGFWSRDDVAYRMAKWFERRLLIGADVVVTLTHSAVRVIRDYPYLKGREKRFEVVPTCTNLELFKPLKKKANGRPFNLGFVGGIRLYLFDEVLAGFLALRAVRPDATLTLVSRDDAAELRRRAEAAGVPLDAVTIRSVPFEDVPGEMNKLDAGIFFLAPTLARQGISPTKLGEFLACGVPCLTNAGVGDFDGMITQSGAGVILREFTAAARQHAVAELLEVAGRGDIRERCVSAAREYFNLESGIETYSRIYGSLQSS